MKKRIVVTIGELMEDLRKASAQTGASMAELIRRGITMVIKRHNRKKK